MRDKGFWRAAAVRAVRTFCQTMLASIGTAALLSDINWPIVLSASSTSAILSILTSIITGLPEAGEY